MTRSIGQRVDTFELQAVLGQGGMATVYLAQNVTNGQSVAVKFIRMEKLPPELADQFLRRFQLEARQTASLKHPHIVEVIGSGYDGADPYLAMEYVSGGTLKERLGQPMPWPKAVGWVLPIAQALELAHQRDIIHRDVKPANILVKADGTPTLSDFGIAKNMASGETTLGATLTMTGALVGTPEYMAPEQARGAAIDHRVDVYALGIVLYELLTGRRPFAADTPWEVLAKQLTEPVPRPSQVVPGLPRQADRIVLKALAKNPHDRYATMGELAADLEAGIRPPRVIRPSWLVAGVGGLLLVAVCLGVSALAYASWTARPGAGSASQTPSVATLTAAPTDINPTVPVVQSTVGVIASAPPIRSLESPTSRTSTPTTGAPTATATSTPTFRPTTAIPTRSTSAAPVASATLVPPTVAPTQGSPTQAPPTSAPPTSAPPTAVPPTDVPPTVAPAPTDTPQPLPPTTEPTPTPP